MKNSASVLTNFILIALGVILCIISDRPQLDHTIVKIIGCGFFIAGVINVFVMMNHSSKRKGNSFTRLSGWISGIAGVLIGLAMFFYPPFFGTILVYLFALILIIGGITQICVMVFGYKEARLSGWLYIIPVVLIVGGVIMMCSDSLLEDIHLMVIITGVGMILYGLNSFFAMGAAAATGSEKTDEAAHAIEPAKETKHIEESTGE